MFAETSFIQEKSNKINLLKHEAIDRLCSVVYTFPKYKELFEKLIRDFTVEDMLWLMNAIYRDTDFKVSLHFTVYDKYFDEIEELIHRL
jgi:hypothetical protein